MKCVAPVGRSMLSVGEHVRLPRTYRGRDVLWWMDVSGVWNQRYDEIDDLTRALGVCRHRSWSEHPSA